MDSSIQKSPSFSQALKRNFSVFDRDEDGLVTPKEVRESLKDDSFQGSDAACLSALYSKRSHLGKLSRLSNDQLGLESGFTRKDLDKLENSTTGKSFQERFQENLVKVQQFPGELYLNDSPTASGVCQGSVGDCWLLAPLAGLASARPEELKSRITPLPTGQFEVTLPSGAVETVAPPSQAEQLSFANGKDGEQWANIYERAVAQDRALSSKEAEFRHSLSSGTAGSGYKPVTGSRSNTDWLPLTRDETIRKRVMKAQSEKRVMTLASSLRPLKSLLGQDTDREGILAGHCYTILGYQPETDELIIRNPWGSDEWTGDPEAKDGVFNMPLEKVRNYFSTVSYEKN